MAVVGQLRSPRMTWTAVPLKGTTVATLCASRAMTSASASVMWPIDACRTPEVCVACGQM